MDSDTPKVTLDGRIWDNPFEGMVMVKKADLDAFKEELAEARRALTNACDNARDFPANTCPASRHVQQIAEGLMSGKYPMLAEEPRHCAESMLATVRALWEARRDAARYRWLRAKAWRTSDLEPPHWCIPETCELGETIDAAIDAAIASEPTPPQL